MQQGELLIGSREIRLERDCALEMSNRLIEALRLGQRHGEVGLNPGVGCTIRRSGEWGHGVGPASAHQQSDAQQRQCAPMPGCLRQDLLGEAHRFIGTGPLECRERPIERRLNGLRFFHFLLAPIELTLT
jgi:hypothetical protein